MISNSLYIYNCFGFLALGHKKLFDTRLIAGHGDFQFIHYSLFKSLVMVCVI